MALGDWFKRKGQEMTAENVEAKAREVDAEIAEKEAVIATMRAGLPTQVLDGDHLAAHRIEHEERELNALKLTKAELEAKARELRASEANAELVADWKRAEEKGRAIPAAALTAAIVTLVEKAQAVLDADANFRDAVPSKARDWEQWHFAGNLMHVITLELYARTKGRLRAPRGVIDSSDIVATTRLASIEGALEEHIAMAFKARSSTQKPEQSGEKAA
jgi:hypothetical protein